MLYRKIEPQTIFMDITNEQWESYKIMFPNDNIYRAFKQINNDFVIKSEKMKIKKDPFNIVLGIKQSKETKEYSAARYYGNMTQILNKKYEEFDQRELKTIRCWMEDGYLVAAVPRNFKLDI